MNNGIIAIGQDLKEVMEFATEVRRLRNFTPFMLPTGEWGVNIPQVTGIETVDLDELIEKCQRIRKEFGFKVHIMEIREV